MAVIKSRKTIVPAVLTGEMIQKNTLPTAGKLPGEIKMHGPWLQIKEHAVVRVRTLEEFLAATIENKFNPK